MRRAKIGGMRCYWTHGSDRHGGGDGPVVVMLHGFAAPLLELASRFEQFLVPDGVRFLFPESPVTVDIPESLLRISGNTWEWEYRVGEAHCWWSLDTQALERAWHEGTGVDRRKMVPDGLAAARERLDVFFDELRDDHGVPPERVILGGHSQGAQLTMDYVLRTDRPFAGAMLNAPTYLAADEWRALMRTREGFRVFVCHGRNDDLLPFGIAEELARDLRSHGVDVEWAPHSGQHEISNPSSMELIARYLFRVFGSMDDFNRRIGPARRAWYLSQLLRVSGYSSRLVQAGFLPGDPSRPKAVGAWRSSTARVGDERGL